MDRKNVLMVAAECVPFAKVGGLGDVLGALPVALEKLGVSVTVAIPRHRTIDLQKFGFESVPVPGEGWIPLGYEQIPYDIQRGIKPSTYVTSFNSYPPAFKAACAILYGEHPVIGKWQP